VKLRDVKESSPDVPSKQQYYTPVEQYEKSIGPFASPTDVNGNGGSVVVRTAIEPDQMANALRATVRSIDSQLPLTHVQSMESMLSKSESPRRFYTTVISAFALVAALLAALGLYSVIAFSTALRTQEMAIRMALGAQRAGVMRLVFASGARVAVVGCAVDSWAWLRFPGWSALSFRCKPFRSVGARFGRSFRTDSGIAGFIAARAARSIHRPHERSARGMTLKPGRPSSP